MMYAAVCVHSTAVVCASGTPIISFSAIFGTGVYDIDTGSGHYEFFSPPTYGTEFYDEVFKPCPNEEDCVASDDDHTNRPTHTDWYGQSSHAYYVGGGGAHIHTAYTSKSGC